MRRKPKRSPEQAVAGLIEIMRRKAPVESIEFGYFPRADGSEPQAGEMTTYWAKARMKSGRVRTAELQHSNPRLGVLLVIAELAREVGLSVNINVVQL